MNTEIVNRASIEIVFAKTEI